MAHLFAFAAEKTANANVGLQMGTAFCIFVETFENKDMRGTLLRVLIAVSAMTAAAVVPASGAADRRWGTYIVTAMEGREYGLFSSTGEWQAFSMSGWSVTLEAVGSAAAGCQPVRLTGFYRPSDVLTGTLDLATGIVTFDVQPIWDGFTFTTYDPATRHPTGRPATAVISGAKMTIDGWTAEYYGYHYAESTHCEYVRLIPGDANSDGSVDATDMSEIIRYMLGGLQPAEAPASTADVNGDGVVNAVDIAGIVVIMLGS